MKGQSNEIFAEIAVIIAQSTVEVYVALCMYI